MHWMLCCCWWRLYDFWICCKPKIRSPRHSPRWCWPRRSPGTRQSTRGRAWCVSLPSHPTRKPSSQETYSLSDLTGHSRRGSGTIRKLFASEVKKRRGASPEAARGPGACDPSPDLSWRARNSHDLWSHFLSGASVPIFLPSAKIRPSWSTHGMGCYMTHLGYIYLVLLHHDALSIQSIQWQWPCYGGKTDLA